MRSSIARLRRSSLLSTVSSLYALQLAGYLLPFISFPYLLRVLGPHQFGLYAFVLVVCRYLIILTDYGFSYSASRDIATQRSLGQDPSGTYGAVVAARMILLAGCAAVLGILTLFVGRFSGDAALYWLGFLGVAGSALFPQWLFQAFERLPLVTGVGLVIRIVSTALVFVLVRDEADVPAAIILWAAPFVLLAAFSLWAARSVLGLRLAGSRLHEVRRAFTAGGSIFVGILASSLYTTSNGFILGLVAGNVAVGLFVAAETVVIGLRGLLDPLAQALYPRGALAATEGLPSLLRHARRSVFALCGLGAALSAGTLLLAPVLGPLLFGDDFERSVGLLQIMSILPLAVAVIICLGSQLMLPLRMDRLYMVVIVLGGIFNILITLLLVPPFREVGTAVAAATTESLIAIILIVIVGRKGLNPLRRRPA